MNEELLKIIEILKTEKTICLLAPSFPVDFSFPEVILDLREIGFTKIVELTYAAKLINYKYIEILKNNPEKQYICPNCPTIVKYIENKYPELKENIIDVASPMVIMARFVKREFGEDYKTIFVGPCFAKKQEAKENSDCVDYAITYKEFCEIYNYLEENNSLKKIEESQENKEIDKFYNDVTKIYPLSGGVAESMLNKQILSKEEIIVCDGPKNIDVSIKDFKEFKTFRFLDILFCEGGCIGGPGIMSKDSLEVKKKKILEYKKECKKTPMGEHFGKFEYYKDLKLRRKL